MIRVSLGMFALVLVAMGTAACGGSSTTSETPKVEDTGPTPEELARQEAEKKKAEEEAKRAEDTKKVGERVAEFEAAHAKEQERWTDDVKKKVATLAKATHASTKSAMGKILKSPHRSPENAARDEYRHPTETLIFFGITPKSTVIEFGAGGGWYTEILAPLLLKKGKLIVVAANPDGPAHEMQTAYGKAFAMFLSLSPELYGAIQTVSIANPAEAKLTEPGSVDVVIAMRELHGWHRRGVMKNYLGAVHAALKDGGTFGVVAHRAAEGANPDESAPKGYLPQAWVIEQVEAAGFKLDKSSEINANKKDTKDYEDGVWTLPPNLRKGDVDRDKYLAIGESDRMTLRFKKIARPADEKTEGGGDAAGEGAE